VLDKYCKISAASSNTSESFLQGAVLNKETYGKTATAFPFKQPNTKLQLTLAILACTALPLIIYCNSLNTPFIFDDHGYIVSNDAIKNFSNVISQIVHPSAYVSNNDPYRPLLYFTFSLNYYFGQLNTFGYHCVNLLLHILTTILIFFLTRKIFTYAYGNSGITLPLLVALFFSSHPMNTEVVTYVSHRSSSLAAMFYLLSLLLFVKTFEKRKFFYPFSLLCFSCALLSKEITVTLPAIILLFDYVFLSNFKIHNVIAKKYYHLPFWILAAVYVTFRYLYLGQIGDPAEGTYNKWTHYTYFITQPHVVMNYLKLLLIPVGQCIDHFIQPVDTVFDFKVILSLFLLSGVFLTIYLIGRRYSSLGKLFLFSTLWFFITLSPTSSFLPINDAMADRRVYLPGWGFSMSLLGLYLWLFKVRLQDTLGKIQLKKIVVFFGIHVLLLSIMT